MKQVDELARDMAVRKFGLPPSLHIPIAAKDEAAIETFVGSVEVVLRNEPTRRALVVQPYDRDTPNESLPIWDMPESAILHATRQVWVDVEYNQYRKAFQEAFPNQDLSGLVIDHVMNRRVARLKGFTLLRVVAISRAANSSSGGLPERWSADYHGKDSDLTRHRHAEMRIQYADLADIVKMMDKKTGNRLQDAVNEAQRWVDPPLKKRN